MGGNASSPVSDTEVSEYKDLAVKCALIMGTNKRAFLNSNLICDGGPCVLCSTISNGTVGFCKGEVSSSTYPTRQAASAEINLKFEVPEISRTTAWNSEI